MTQEILRYITVLYYKYTESIFFLKIMIVVLMVVY
jgi:hypothetical protein